MNWKIIFLLTASFLLSCGQTGNISVSSSEKVSSTPPAGNPTGPTPPAPPAVNPPPSPIYKSYLKSVEVKSTSKVDILVVIDNSKSMATEQSNMSDRFSTFIDELNGLDWQLAITTTDVGRDADLKDGRLLKYKDMGETTVLDSTMDINKVKVAFAKTIKRDEIGSPNEQGIMATYRALERSQSSLSVNAGNRKLIRDGAALAVIVVTDADESPFEDSNGNTVFTEKNLPAGLIAYVNKTWNGNKTMSFHSIIVKDNDKECLDKDGNEAYGLHYIELSQKTNGIVGSVCEKDYGSQLSVIGQKVQQLVKSVRLECAPVDLNQDGYPDVVIRNSNSSIIPNSRMLQLDLVFDQSLPIGMNDISYQCLAPK